MAALPGLDLAHFEAIESSPQIAREAAETLVQSALSTIPDTASDKLRHVEVSVVSGDPILPSSERSSRRDEVLGRATLGSSGLVLAVDALGDREASAALEWIRDPSGIARLQELEGFDLVLYERRADNVAERYTASRPKWSGLGSIVERMRCPASGLGEEDADSLLAVFRELDGHWDKPGLGLVRCWTAKSTSRPEILDEVGGALEKMATVVGRWNYLVRRAKAAKAPALERASWRAQ